MNGGQYMQLLWHISAEFGSLAGFMSGIMADLVFVVLRTEESDYNPRYPTTDV